MTAVNKNQNQNQNKHRPLIYKITDFKYSREITQRFPYPFYRLNQITGGSEVGALNILFAKTNSAKSELIMQFMCTWIDYGYKVCAMLGEHTMRKAQASLYKKVSRYDKDKWITKSYGVDKNGKDLGIYETFISEEDEQRAIEFFGDNLYLYDTRNGFDLNSILAGFEEGYKQGCQIFVTDNMMMLEYEGVSSELREQTDNTEKLRQWAKSHQVVCYLVAHARKIEVDRIRLTETDIQGSGNVSNKATTIITITRTNNLDPSTKQYRAYAKLLSFNYINIEKCDAVLEVVKEKNAKGAGFVPLKWFESTKTFKEVYDPEMEEKRSKDKDDKAVLYAPKDEKTSEIVFDDNLVPLEDDEYNPF